MNTEMMVACTKTSLTYRYGYISEYCTRTVVGPPVQTLCNIEC